MGLPLIVRLGLGLADSDEVGNPLSVALKLGELDELGVELRDGECVSTVDTWELVRVLEAEIDGVAAPVLLLELVCDRVAAADGDVVSVGVPVGVLESVGVVEAVREGDPVTLCDCEEVVCCEGVLEDVLLCVCVTEGVRDCDAVTLGERVLEAVTLGDGVLEGVMEGVWDWDFEFEGDCVIDCVWVGEKDGVWVGVVTEKDTLAVPIPSWVTHVTVKFVQFTARPESGQTAVAEPPEAIVGCCVVEHGAVALDI